MKTTSRITPFAGRGQRVLTLLVIAIVLGLVPASAADATLTEMLELGIYSEETKGDLPAAIKLYEQIVTEADAGQALAAQAQFRLATCYHKQGDYAAATAAFKKLVSLYPEQSELVALSKEYLAEGPVLLPVPWADGEDLHFAVRLSAGPRVGLGRWTARAGEQDGRKIWQFHNHVRGGAQQWSRVEVDAATFKPIHCLWKVSVIGTAETTYTADGANVRMNAAEEARHIPLDSLVWDNEQAVYLIRRLPLAEGYSTTLNIFTGLTGGNVIEVPVSVVGRETITVPAGTYECIKVRLKVALTEQTIWYATNEQRHLVRMDAGGAVIELTRTGNVANAAPVTYQDPVFGFSVSLPAGWMLDRMNSLEDTKRAALFVLDPAGIAMTQLTVHDRSRFDASDVASPRAWAEHQIEQGRKHSTRLEVDPDSWQDLTVAGHPAVSVTAEVIDGPLPAPQTMRAVFALIDGHAVEIRSSTPPEDAAAFAPQFDAVVAGYRSP